MTPLNRLIVFFAVFNFVICTAGFIASSFPANPTARLINRVLSPVAIVSLGIFTGMVVASIIIDAIGRG